MLKLTIEEKVRKAQLDVYNMDRLTKKLRAAQVEAMVKRQKMNPVVFNNHCSPNRNLLGFKYTFKPNTLKTQCYFKKIEEMIAKSTLTVVTTYPS